MSTSNAHLTLYKFSYWPSVTTCIVKFNSCVFWKCVHMVCYHKQLTPSALSLLVLDCFGPLIQELTWGSELAGVISNYVSAVGFQFSLPLLSHSQLELVSTDELSTFTDMCYAMKLILVYVFVLYYTGHRKSKSDVWTRRG